MIHLRDIRYAFRLLARTPGFTLLTVLVLAGGMGLSTFTFSFLYTAIFRPLPLDEGDRIVRLTRMEDGRRRPVNAVDVEALRHSMRTVLELGGYTKREVLLGRDGDRRVVMATVTDPGLFTVARTPARAGRTLLPSDAAAGAEPVIVLTHRLWEVAFSADRAAVDSHVVINGVITRVVGVMPDGFGFPVSQEAWLPLPASVIGSTSPGNEALSVFGRLAPGVTHTQAASEATALLQRAVAAREPAAQRETTKPITNAMVVEPFPAAQIGDERTIVFTSLNLLTCLILLLSLINVTILLAARANERTRETAVRMALGASTSRLVLQGMWESAILCIAGGLIGTAAAAWGLDAITQWTRANMEGSLAFWWVWQMDRVTLLSAGAFVTVAIAFLGSVVSLRAMRTNVREVMQDGCARSGWRREGRLARTLVVTQVATVTVLMFVGVLSAVMARRVVDMDPGYDPENLLQIGLEPSTERFRSEEARASVFKDAQSRLAEHRALDGAILRTTLADRDRRGTFALRESPTTGALPSAHIVATLGAMSTFGIDVIEGRPLDATDDRTQAPVVLISRSLARHWQGRSPIGDRLRLAGVGDTRQWRTVVGVVSDIPYGNQLARDRSRRDLRTPATVRRTRHQCLRPLPHERGRRSAGAAPGVRSDRPVARSRIRAPLRRSDSTSRPGHHRIDQTVRKLLRLRPPDGRRGNLRPHVAVDRHAHARDWRPARTRRLRRDCYQDAARAGSAPAGRRHAGGGAGSDGNGRSLDLPLPIERGVDGDRRNPGVPCNRRRRPCGDLVAHAEGSARSAT